MLDFDNTGLPENNSRSLKQDLVELCNQYDEFNAYCAFFCDSASLLILANEDTFKSCTHGAHLFSMQLIKRSQYFKERLDQILEKVEV